MRQFPVTARDRELKPVGGTGRDGNTWAQRRFPKSLEWLLPQTTGLVEYRQLAQLVKRIGIFVIENCNK